MERLESLDIKEAADYLDRSERSACLAEKISARR
jgi:hypothetical protein